MFKFNVKKLFIVISLMFIMCITNVKQVKAEKVLESLDIVGLVPTLDYYVGESLSVAGLEVYACYDDWSEEEITPLVTWTFNPEVFTEVGDNITCVATASYGGKTKSYTVTDIRVSQRMIARINTVQYTTLQEAFDNIQMNDRLELLYGSNEVITVDKNITFVFAPYYTFTGEFVCAPGYEMLIYPTLYKTYYFSNIKAKIDAPVGGSITGTDNLPIFIEDGTFTVDDENTLKFSSLDNSYTYQYSVNDGYEFNGWTISINDGDPILINEEYNLSKDSLTGDVKIGFIAKSLSNNVSFDLQGKGDSITSLAVDYNGKVTKPADPTCDGYKFLGWFKDSECNTPWDFENDVVTNDTVLYAKWEQNINTVDPEQNNNTGEPEQNNNNGLKVFLIILFIILFILLIYIAMYIIWKKKDKALKFLVPSFRAINNLLFKTSKNDVELEEENKEEKSEETKENTEEESN